MSKKRTDGFETLSILVEKIRGKKFVKLKECKRDSIFKETTDTGLEDYKSNFKE